MKIDYLNSQEKYDTKYLNSFQGSSPMSTYLELKDPRFLEEHHRKNLPIFEPFVVKLSVYRRLQCFLFFVRYCLDLLSFLMSYLAFPFLCFH